MIEAGRGQKLVLLLSPSSPRPAPPTVLTKQMKANLEAILTSRFVSLLT